MWDLVVDFIRKQWTYLACNLLNFSGFPCWSFVSETFNQLMNSWNVNLRVIFDLPYGTHSHLVDSLTDGKHARKMIYTRYLKFLKSLATNRRPALTALLRIVTETRRSWTGQNIRKILLDTNVTVVPGVTNHNPAFNRRDTRNLCKAKVAAGATSGLCGNLNFPVYGNT